MATYPAPDGGNKKRLWTGRILSGLVVAFLLFDAGSYLRDDRLRALIPFRS